MTFNGHTQEELMRQLLTPKKEGVRLNPHVSTQKPSKGIDFPEVSRQLQSAPSTTVPDSRVKNG